MVTTSRGVHRLDEPGCTIGCGIGRIVNSNKTLGLVNPAHGIYEYLVGVLANAFLIFERCEHWEREYGG